MSGPLRLGRFSLGVGDRFGRQAGAQLAACQRAAELGVEVIPVWNKSNREHTTIGSEPASVREAADAAIRQASWSHPYFVDADHINLETVDRFLPTSDFFTIDVADAIGKPATAEQQSRFVQLASDLVGRLEIPGLLEPLEITQNQVAQVAEKYLFAVQRAGTIYRHIASQKGEGTFITEVSMDETDQPQTPPELLIILRALADEGIPAQTIAPKFTGRFNKGVDYVGNVSQFEREFRDDLAVIAFAVRSFGLPDNLKLSVHSGSDKFSLYPVIRRAVADSGAGWHLKTAGTTWLEELIGLAEAGGSGLEIAKQVYAKAYDKREALCAPYASVIDINYARLPVPDEVFQWNADQYTSALRHIPTNPLFNADFRQLLHVGYKIAAQLGDHYHAMLHEHASSIHRNVVENLWDRHLQPLISAT
jgi:hypothetical protein